MRRQAALDGDAFDGAACDPPKGNKQQSVRFRLQEEEDYAPQAVMDEEEDYILRFLERNQLDEKVVAAPQKEEIDFLVLPDMPREDSSKKSVSRRVSESSSFMDPHYKKLRHLSRKEKPTPEQLQERNLLWFAPPVTELEGWSLGAFTEWDPFRLQCVRLLTSTTVQTFFWAVNLVNCVMLAVKPAREGVVYNTNEYGDYGPAPYYFYGNYYLYIEILGAVCLALEMVLAVVARGLVDGHYAFVKDPFNVLDSFVLLATVIELPLLSKGWTMNVRVFRIFRCLKPLMSVSSFDGIKDVVLNMWRTLGEYRALLTIFLIVLYAFSVSMLPILPNLLRPRCVLAGTTTRNVVQVFDDSSLVRVSTPEVFCSLLLNRTRSGPPLRSAPCLPALTFRYAHAHMHTHTHTHTYKEVCVRVVHSPVSVLGGGLCCVRACACRCIG